MSLMRRFSLVYSLLIALLVGTALLNASGCGEDTSTTASTAAATTAVPPGQEPIPFDQPETTPPVEQPSPYGPGSTGSQSVGTLVDGMQLRDIRWADHGTYFRVVFEMGTPDGQAVLQVPHADASMSADKTKIKVILGGIRSIGTNANVTTASLDVGDTLVKTIKRIPSGDDQALEYEIDLAGAGAYSLAGVGSPGRIIIDINKT